MLTGIYTKNRHGKNIYMFRVGEYPFKTWLYVLNSREAAEASHRQIAGIKSEVDTIFAFIRAGLEYDKIEPHAKILAELVRGTWTPDKLYDYLKMLFTKRAGRRKMVLLCFPLPSGSLQGYRVYAVTSYTEV